MHKRPPHEIQRSQTRLLHRLPLRSLHAELGFGVGNSFQLWGNGQGGGGGQFVFGLVFQFFYEMFYCSYTSRLMLYISFANVFCLPDLYLDATSYGGFAVPSSLHQFVPALCQPLTSCLGTPGV